MRPFSAKSGVPERISHRKGRVGRAASFTKTPRNRPSWHTECFCLTYNPLSHIFSPRLHFYLQNCDGLLGRRCDHIDEMTAGPVGERPVDQWPGDHRSPLLAARREIEIVTLTEEVVLREQSTYKGKCKGLVWSGWLQPRRKGDAKTVVRCLYSNQNVSELGDIRLSDLIRFREKCITAPRLDVPQPGRFRVEGMPTVQRTVQNQANDHDKGRRRINQSHSVGCHYRVTSFEGTCEFLRLEVLVQGFEHQRETGLPARRTIC